MATTTLGTVNTSNLVAIQWQPGGLAAADLATIRNSILNDKILGLPNPIWPGALEDGKLYIPNRGVVSLLPGDWIGVDSNGWAILLPGSYIPAVSGMSTTGTIQSGSAVVTGLATNVLTLLWAPGMQVAGSGISAGAQIQSIAAGGSSLTMTLVASATSAAATLSVGGGWTHP
jgi:hypothetical protein